MTKKNVKIYKQWRLLTILLLAVCFFVGTASYNYFVQRDNFVKFGSPDENANYVFAKLYAQTGELAVFEKYNQYADDIMRPRSMRSDGGVIKPVSFLGIILIYGTIAKLTSYKLIPYLTPFFGAIGILFFYLLIKKIFGPRNAFISAFLLASFPVYAYYDARSMFHNVLFAVLLIMGLYFLVSTAAKPSKAEKINFSTGRFASLSSASLAGLFFGLAIMTRTSELLWLAPMLVVLWLFYARKVGAAKLILFLSFLFLAVLPQLYYNQILYGGFWKGGYSEMNESIAQIALAGSDIIKSAPAGKMAGYRELLERVKDNVFYFGFHPRQSAEMFIAYFAKMFYWIFWPAVLGLTLFARKARKWKRKHIAYLAAYFVVSLILVVYYGSWKFYDNPDPSRVTIGNSYTRYWLPIYLGALPFVSMFIIRITKYIKNFRGYWGEGSNKKSSNPLCQGGYIVTAGRIVIVVLISLISLQFVLFGSEEGLVYSYNKQRRAKYEFDRVLALTEPNAVIITQYHDKLFFPERKVIFGLFDDKTMVAKYAKAADYLPVYYYNFTLPPDAIDYLNRRRLKEAGLRVQATEKINDSFTLYKIEKSKTAN